MWGFPSGLSRVPGPSGLLPGQGGKLQPSNAQPIELLPPDLSLGLSGHPDPVFGHMGLNDLVSTPPSSHSRKGDLALTPPPVFPELNPTNPCKFEPDGAGHVCKPCKSSHRTPSEQQCLFTSCSSTPGNPPTTAGWLSLHTAGWPFLEQLALSSHSWLALSSHSWLALSSHSWLALS